MSNETVLKGLSRLAYQYSDSEKFKGFLTAFLDEFQYLQDQNELLATMRTLDNSQGVQLDGLGEIIGLERPSEPIELAGIFGFVNDDEALGFGTTTDSEVGGNWLSVNSITTQPIGDNLYRLLLRARAVQNRISMRVDETTSLISFMFSGARVRYFLEENLEPRYDIEKLLTPFEQNLLKDLPVLIGIDTVEYHTYAQDTTFGFAGDPDALGFGSTTDPNLGGNFASIV